MELERKQLETGMIMDATALNTSTTSDSSNANAVAASAITGGTVPTGYIPRKPRPRVKDHKIGRNELCPCGSGKKYKNCCLDSGKYETYHTV